jgi:hypothetical protein
MTEMNPFEDPLLTPIEEYAEKISQPLQHERYIDHLKAYAGVNKQQQEFKEKQENANTLLKQSFNALCNTKEGVLVFRHLCETLGFKQSSLFMVNGKLETDGITYNESRRNVWIELRKLLTVENRNRIERDE